MTKRTSQRSAMLAGMIAGLSLIAATVYAADHHDASGGSATTNINEWSICKDVVNANAEKLFVPTNTSGEWSSLVNNGAPNVSLTDCGGGGGGGGGDGGCVDELVCDEWVLEYGCPTGTHFGSDDYCYSDDYDILVGNPIVVGLSCDSYSTQCI